MAVGNIEDAWWNAEQVCGAYLRDIIGGDLDKNAFIGETPKDLDYASEPGQWMFEINGGGSPIDEDINMATPGGFGDKKIWRMAAHFKGVWQERKVGMRNAGKIRAALPKAEDTLEGIFRFQIAGEPTIERGTIERKSDSAIGGMIRVWQVEMDLTVWFRPVPTA